VKQHRESSLSINSDDTGMCANEFMDWLDDQPELDAVCENIGPWVVVLLSDHVYMVKRPMWDLILTVKPIELS
jgi:hypothetical protein